MKDYSDSGISNAGTCWLRQAHVFAETMRETQNWPQASAYLDAFLEVPGQPDDTQMAQALMYAVMGAPAPDTAAELKTVRECLYQVSGKINLTAMLKHALDYKAEDWLNRFAEVYPQSVYLNFRQHDELLLHPHISDDFLSQLNILPFIIHGANGKINSNNIIECAGFFGKLWERAPWLMNEVEPWQTELLIQTADHFPSFKRGPKGPEANKLRAMFEQINAWQKRQSLSELANTHHDDTPSKPKPKF